MTLDISDLRFSLIQDDQTRDVIRDLVVNVASIQGGTVTSVALSAPASVFSVTGSPATGAGTLGLSFASQMQGLALMSPAGASGVPSFRAIVAADLPAGTGSVTSVALSAPAIFTVSGSPVTTSGTLALTLATQAANLSWCGPTTGAPAAPAFRALVNADLPAVLAASTSLAIGGGTALTGAVVYAPNLTPGSVAAGTTAEQDFTVTGLATTDTITLNPPGLTAGVAVTGWRVKAANTLTLQFTNPTAGALTPAAGVHRVLAVRS